MTAIMRETKEDTLTAKAFKAQRSTISIGEKTSSELYRIEDLAAVLAEYQEKGHFFHQGFKHTSIDAVIFKGTNNSYVEVPFSQYLEWEQPDKITAEISIEYKPA